MIWVLLGALGVAAWLSVVVLLLALCRAAAQADERMLAGDRRRVFVRMTENRAENVIALPARRRRAA